MLERRRQERLARDEQHDEFRRRAQRRPVCLGGQPVDVLTQVPRVRVEAGPRARPSSVALRGLQVGGERDLGVDHDVLAAGQPDDHVRALRAVVAGTATCSSKSQRALIPASSTTRRSCSSPQRPRASGRRSAVTSAWVWARSCSELCRAWSPARPARLGSVSGPRRTPALDSPPGPGSPSAA